MWEEKLISVFVIKKNQFRLHSKPKYIPKCYCAKESVWFMLLIFRNDHWYVFPRELIQLLNEQKMRYNVALDNNNNNQTASLWDCEILKPHLKN